MKCEIEVNTPLRMCFITVVVPFKKEVCLNFDKRKWL